MKHADINDVRREEGLEAVRAAFDAAATHEQKESKVLNGAKALDQVHAFLGRFVAYPSIETPRRAHAVDSAHAPDGSVGSQRRALRSCRPSPAPARRGRSRYRKPLVPRPVEAVNVTPAYLFRKVGSEEGRADDPVRRDRHRVRAQGQRTTRRSAAFSTPGIGAAPSPAAASSKARSSRRRKSRPTAPSPSPASAACPTRSSRELSSSGCGAVPRASTVEPYRRRVHAPEGRRTCAKQLERWAELVIEARRRWPAMPDGIEDRNADVWEALLAVADAAGGDWPERARVAAVTLVTLSKESTPSLGIRLLSDLRQVFAQAEVLATERILHTLHDLDESPWADIKGKPLNDRGLAVRLRPFGIKPKVVRIGETTHRGYAREDFHDPWLRYLGPPPRESVTTVTPETPSACCASCGNPQRSEDPLLEVADGKGRLIAVHRGCIDAWSAAA